MAAVTIPGIGPVEQKWVVAGGAVVVALVGYSFWRRTPAAPAEVEELVPDEAGADVGDGWGNTPGHTGDSSGDRVPDGDMSPRTAAEWTQQAVDKLSAMGWDAQLVATAVGKWLGRQGLTVPEQEVIRTAKAVMGAVPGVSPEPPILPALPPPPGTKPPGPKPPAPNPKPPAPAPGSRRGYGWHKVKRGESAAGIAKQYGMTLATFYAFNGPAALATDSYVKVRLNSNPVFGPYYGR